MWVFIILPTCGHHGNVLFSQDSCNRSSRFNHFGAVLWQHVIHAIKIQFFDTAHDIRGNSLLMKSNFIKFYLIMKQKVIFIVDSLGEVLSEENVLFFTPQRHQLLTH